MQLSPQISIRLGEDHPQQDQGARKGEQASVWLIGCHHLQSEAAFTFCSCYTAFPCTHKQMPTWMWHQEGSYWGQNEGSRKPRGLAEFRILWSEQRGGVSPHRFVESTAHEEHGHIVGCHQQMGLERLRKGLLLSLLGTGQQTLH